MHNIWREELKNRNIKIAGDLWRNVKKRAFDNDIELKQWVAHALEIALDFDTYAKEYCRSLGWKEKP